MATAKTAKAAKPRAKVAKPAAAAESSEGWIDAGGGYELTLANGKLVARKDGKRLASVPKPVRAGPAADQLDSLSDWLDEHDRDCIATVDTWMLRSLPVPRSVLEAVWDDPSWRRPLDNAVVVPIDANGAADPARGGLFRGVDRKRGVGVVDLDGETSWLDTDRIAIPHPILIPELDAWRELVTQLAVTQGIAQLHRETHVKTPAERTGDALSITRFEDGKFAMLMHALGKSRALGYKVRGGYAVCTAWDAGATSEARYWVGADAPDSETYTGSLGWVDGKARAIKLAEVGPIAFSEGMRMASAIYAARVVDKPAEGA